MAGEHFFPPLPGKPKPGDMTIDELLQQIQQLVNTFYQTVTFTGDLTVQGYFRTDTDGNRIQINPAGVGATEASMQFFTGASLAGEPVIRTADVGGEWGLVVSSGKSGSNDQAEFVFRSDELVQMNIGGVVVGFFAPTGMQLLNGTAAAPSLAASAETTTGLAFATGAIIESISGTEVGRFTADGYTETGGSVHNSFTPTLEGSATNPTLGTGSDTAGQYSINGGWCEGWVRWRFGTASVNAGSGVYQFTPPVNMHASVVGSTTTGEGTIVGYGWIRDNSVAADSVGVVLQPLDADTIRMVPVDNNAFVANNSPWTWAASDRITIHFRYPIA